MQMRSRSIHLNRPIDLSRRCNPALWALLVGLLFIWGPDVAFAGAGEDLELQASILRVKPAVVLISSEVGAEVSVDCGIGPVHKVQPDPIYETGSGFVIHPDGFIATNGHVVERYYEMNERELAKQFLKKAVARACGPALAMVPDGARRERLAAIAADPVNRDKVRLVKKLQVHLSTGDARSAEVRAYSPTIKREGPVSRAAASGGKTVEADRTGKDVAILKIEARDLPTLRLAPPTPGLKLGEQIFVIGFPGVVLHHDFLSRKSRLEASVTVGRVSGLKFDVNERRVIQTDASITWGNSGGPAFNLQGEVVGVATFISTTFEGDQAVQGFNFLIPAESVHQFCGQVGVPMNVDARFMTEWSEGVAAYFRGEFRRSLAHLESAERIMSGFPDVQRLLAEAQMKVDMHPRFLRRGRTFGLGIGVVLLGALAAVGVRTLVQRRSARRPGSVRRMGPDEIRRRLEAGTVAVLDVRHGANFDDSPVQVAGAVRYDIDHPDVRALRVQVNPDGEVVAYCD
ncbi:MAG: hypothetical protein EHM71_02490 [Zetaproteobacteria bacterium]|nr:MAG: hypothetical protein EHM71_02490 [Zetaproteobacteria bacterium]